MSTNIKGHCLSPRALATSCACGHMLPFGPSPVPPTCLSPPPALTASCCVFPLSFDFELPAIFFLPPVFEKQYEEAYEFWNRNPWVWILIYCIFIHSFTIFVLGHTVISALALLHISCGLGECFIISPIIYFLVYKTGILITVSTYWASARCQAVFAFSYSLFSATL